MARWMRGGVRCAECGGQNIVHRPQAMTRHSRGTQLSTIGWRELPLCRGCDVEVLEKSTSQNTPVPSDYVAVHGAHRPAGHRRVHGRVLRPGRRDRDAAARHPAATPNYAGSGRTCHSLRSAPEAAGSRIMALFMLQLAVGEDAVIEADAAGRRWPRMASPAVDRDLAVPLIRVTRAYGSDPDSPLNGVTEEVPGAVGG
ncbi:hypothetical protein ABZ078_21480 [Streptomyces sp. NPDC006385]|uniref:hypothetical protein n=1 Tax=Streptomyces sp. NPDC006385 TaxID=3156761 RepID=UPI0033B7D7AE